MQHAQQGFADGYDKIVIIGSDLIALESDDIIAAIENLDNNDIVVVLQKMVAITF
jgi:2-phospho-L-lactate guanylyltransferase (CobY/MobA/RfbA family)